MLVGLGLRTVLDRPRFADSKPSSNNSGLAWAYLSTLGLTLANPATILSFAALVVALGLGVGGGYLRPALLVLGVLVGSAAWWCVLAGLAAGLRARVTPKVVQLISTFSGLVIAALGLLAIVSTLTAA